MPHPNAPEPRHVPKQQRSRAIVEAILEAGRRLLESEGVDALTTHRIAERAGISIGSLYRSFANKETVIAAICEHETQRDLAEIRGAEHWEIDALPLRDALAAIVDYQIARHARLVALGQDVYRAHQDEYSLTTQLGADEVVARMRELLERHRELVRARDLDVAAFVIGRGVSAIVRRALEERPGWLGDAAFRDELLELAFQYLTAQR